MYVVDEKIRASIAVKEDLSYSVRIDSHPVNPEHIPIEGCSGALTSGAQLTMIMVAVSNPALRCQGVQQPEQLDGLQANRGETFGRGKGREKTGSAELSLDGSKELHSSECERLTGSGCCPPCQRWAATLRVQNARMQDGGRDAQTNSHSNSHHDRMGHEQFKLRYMHLRMEKVNSHDRCHRLLQRYQSEKLLQLPKGQHEALEQLFACHAQRALTEQSFSH